MMVEVFGPGCMRCEQTAKMVQEAIIKSGRDDVGMTKITDPNAISARGVMMTPAIAIDGQIKCQGRIPSEKEFLGWIGN